MIPIYDSEIQCTWSCTAFVAYKTLVKAGNSILTFEFQFYRNTVSERNILQSKDIIVACKNTLCAQTGEGKEKQLILCLKALTEAFRFLRNCCAETPKNQNSIV